jgi:hypothetical protein
MAALTVQDVTRSGLTPTFAAATSTGDSFANNGSTFLYVKNGHTAAQSVTVDSQYAPLPVGTAQSDAVVSVAAGGEALIGPFPTRSFNDADGLVQVTYSGVTALTVAAIKV